MKEMVGGCCVCSDERGWPDNPLVYCDGNGCTVAVHQACYGIVTVPTGPWYCRKCESPEIKGKVKCELCPSKSGALKPTDTSGWAHVVCALYIPEVRFGNVTSMEPIVLRLIPPERYNKVCYICQDSGKPHRANAGACMPCNKSGCKQQFHVTCAQSLGLLCEEAGNYLDNVKYCGYCQHHYSKLKKGGNVKTIPPYKPVSQDSHSSDSSCEKEGDASPMAGGNATPSHATKSKGPGRKSSHAGKNTPSTSKSSSNSNQSMGGKLHQTDKKKPSPARRGSSAADGGSGSKNNTPAPSPQHPPPDHSVPSKASSGLLTSSGAKASAISASPSPKSEPVGVINAAPAAAPVSVAASTSASTAASNSVVHATTMKPPYQESVITNVEIMETKQTKKRKAVSAANAAAIAVDYATPQTVPTVEVNPPTSIWEGARPSDMRENDHMDKIIKRAKTEAVDMSAPSAFVNQSPAPPPPPAHSPASHSSHPSPRHLPSPMPGPSGMNTVSKIRSPKPLQGGKEREMPTSLLVSVPLPTASHGLNLSAHAQVSAASDMTGLAHIFHQQQKQAAMEPGMAGHVAHGVTGRPAWGNLNVTYEMQQELKVGGPGLSTASKEVILTGVPMPPTTIRTKKRAAMAASAVSMANQPPPTSMQSPMPQSLASIRRAPPPTPQPIYQETIKDSPPSSPSSDRLLKPPKMENKLGGVGCSAPHMLGNELNPESGAAARLQEQLSAELAAHAAGAAGHDPMLPPPLINKAAPSTSGLGRGGTSSAQSLDQLLERQWEQGSQFLMEQAQHFDIASLLSCLHQLRTENVRLEDHVGSLLQRRDHLLAVNARLAIPLTNDYYNAATAAPPPGPPELLRCPRDPGVRDPCPRDPCPRDPCPRDPSIRDPCPRDPGPRDLGPRDMGMREMGPRDMGPQDLGPRGLGPRDFGPRDLGPRDFGPRDLGPRDMGPRDMGPRDMGPRDMGPRDMGPRDMGPRDMGPRDMGPRDMGPRDMGPRDMGLRDMGLREMIPRDMVPRDMIPRDLVTRDMAPREMTPRDMVTRDMIPRDLIPRDMITRDMITRDMITRDLMQRDMGPRDLIQRDIGPRDLIQRDMGPRDLIHRDMGPRDMGPRDMGPRDMGPRDMTPRDMGPRDLTPRDMGPRDLTSRDMTPRDMTPRDMTPRDMTPRDMTPRDMTPRDMTPRDMTPRDMTPRDMTPRDMTPRDMTSRGVDLAPRELGPRDLGPHIGPRDPCPRDPGPRPPPPPPAMPVRTETITSDRSHQLMMREMQQKPS